MSTAPKPHVRSLNCPNCGGSVEIRGMGRTQTVVCIQCLTILDATTPELRILETFQGAQRFRPLIPLGTRGKVRGDPYEAIGFQVRQLTVDGVHYRWAEYLLFNPYKGFRYLSEYNGHWNDIAVLHSVPKVGGGIRPTASVLGETFKHFQHYNATTIFVMGEFPWRVKVGETATCDDYVAPPRILSREASQDEVVWSVGEYTPGDTIWANFQLQGKAPAPIGVFANQPSPHKGRTGIAWRYFVLSIVALLAIQLFFVMFHSGKTVFEQKYSFAPSPLTSENSFVTSVFEVQGRRSNVSVDIDTDLENSWAFFNMALIDTDTGEAYDFSREVSYYHGQDSDGSWSEGSRHKNVVLSSVPSGSYYLRVEPEMEAAPGRTPPVMFYTIRVKRDVTTWVFFLIGLGLLFLPPIWVTIRSGAFEAKRWAESDYAPSSE